MTEPQQKPFLPFWATPQYGGGLLQGLGIGLASIFLLQQISPDFVSERNGALGIIGFVLLIVGGLKARKSGSEVGSQ